jgi:hypothetical protein
MRCLFHVMLLANLYADVLVDRGALLAGNPNAVNSASRFQINPPGVGSRFAGYPLTLTFLRIFF